MKTFKDYLDSQEVVPEVEGAEGDDTQSGSARFSDALKYASDILLEAKQEVDRPGSVASTFNLHSTLEQVKVFACDAADFANEYVDAPASGQGATFL